MKQTIQLRLGQQLTMTPQLQQAIKLLQLSTLDLQREIQDALESNLMLENADDADLNADSDLANLRSQTTDARVDNELHPERTSIPDELPVDSNWSDTFDSYSAPVAAAGDTEFRSFCTTITTANSVRSSCLAAQPR